MSQKTPRKKLISELKLELGNQMIDVELDPEHYDLAIDQAIEKMRQLSEGSVEESHIFLTMHPEQSNYQLPDEVLNVRKVHRRGIGTPGNSSAFDPYEATFLSVYSLNNNRGGGLANWEFAHAYMETAGRLLASEINFRYNTSSKTMTIARQFRSSEEVLLTVDNLKPDIVLLTDPFTLPWIRTYAMGKCKVMLGEAREKFSTIAGPNGGTQLNGAQLKSEGTVMIEQALDELKGLQTGSIGMPFMIG